MMKWNLTDEENMLKVSAANFLKDSAVGVAPIDPQPITQLAGEGIDPDQDTTRPPPAADIVSRLPLRP